MGLLNKLKNVLFEVEEIEVPIEEPVKKERVQKEVKPQSIPKEEYHFEEEDSISPLSDRELFKAEKTFDFPEFDINEFESMKSFNKEKEESETPKSMGINLIDYERPKTRREQPRTLNKPEEIKGRIYQTPRRETVSPSSKFKPSPVISPVYGVLDKNYTKEDFKEEIVKEKKTIDVDDVRKKAFGTLEEDLEKTLSKPLEKFYGDENEKSKKDIIEEPKKVVEEKKKIMPNKKIEEEKSIEDLLEETAFESISLEEENNEKQIITNKVIEEEDTLESDLFDLIDSMYENKEE